MELKKIIDESLPESDFVDYYAVDNDNKGLFIVHAAYERKKLLFFKKCNLHTKVSFCEGIKCEDYKMNDETFPQFESITQEYQDGIAEYLYKSKVAIMKDDFDTESTSGAEGILLEKKYNELFNKYKPMLEQLPEEIKKNIGLIKNN